MKPIAYIRNCAAEGAFPEWYEVHESFSDSEGVIAVVPLAEYKALQKENVFLINDLHIARCHIATLKAEQTKQMLPMSRLGKRPL